MTATDTARQRPALLPRGKGVRWFGASTLVNATGTGFLYPFSLLFFHSLMKLGYTTVGITLSATALIVLPAMRRLGRIIDRAGPRRVLIAANLLRAVAFIGYVTFRSFIVFVVISAAVAICGRAEQTATPVLAAVSAPDEKPAPWLALYRVTFNVGVGLGALGGSLALALGGQAYSELGVADAASFLCAALLYVPLREVRAPEARHPETVRPWRDRFYVQLAVANALFWLVAVAVETGISAYVIRNLDMPSWTVGPLFVVNTLLIAGLQLPAARYISGHNPLVMIAVGAGLNGTMLVSLALFGDVARPRVTVGVALLITTMVLYTLGELLTFQALLVLLTVRAPPAERGSYLAFSQVLAGIATGAVWVVVTFFLDVWPAGLWWALSLIAGLAAASTAGRHWRLTSGSRA